MAGTYLRRGRAVPAAAAPAPSPVRQQNQEKFPRDFSAEGCCKRAVWGAVQAHLSAQRANAQAVHVCAHAWCKHICARVSRAGRGAPTLMRVHAHADMCIQMHTCISVCTQLLVHTLTLACMHLHMHALAHSCSCPCERACRHTHGHVWVPWLLPSLAEQCLSPPLPCHSGMGAAPR